MQDQPSLLCCQLVREWGRRRGICSVCCAARLPIRDSQERHGQICGMSAIVWGQCLGDGGESRYRPELYGVLPVGRDWWG